VFIPRVEENVLCQKYIFRYTCSKAMAIACTPTLQIQNAQLVNFLMVDMKLSAASGLWVDHFLR